MDMFYRYKRDKLVLKKVGEFYVLDNIEAVIKSLNLKVDLLSELFDQSDYSKEEL